MSTENSGDDGQCRSIRHLLLLLTILSGVAYAKTDVVVFNNGDRLTGDLKSLERGRLRFKTDATGTINIEWDEVAYLSSDQNIQVETILGARYLGHLTRADEKFSVVVQSRKGPIKLNNTQVVHMTPIEDEGVNRIDGEITAGYNFTKANEVTQLNFGVELDYRTEVRIWSLDLDAGLTHGHEQVGDPLVLGLGFGVGSAQDEAPVGPGRAGGPDLLTTDDPLVADELGLRLYVGEIGARVGFGVALAPELLSTTDRRQEARLLGAAAEGDQGRPDQPLPDVAEPTRRGRARVLLVEDHLLRQARASTAVLAWPAHAGPARLTQLAFPGASLFEQGAVVAGTSPTAQLGELARQVLVEPVRDLSAEGLVFLAESYVHPLLDPSAPGYTNFTHSLLSSRIRYGDQREGAVSGILPDHSQDHSAARAESGRELRRS